MSGAPVRKDNGGALAKFIVSAVLFVLGFVGTLIMVFAGIGDPFDPDPGFAFQTDAPSTSFIIILIALAVITAMYVVSPILLCSGFKTLSRINKGKAKAFGGAKISILVILGSIFFGIGFYVFMSINRLTTEGAAILLGYVFDDDASIINAFNPNAVIWRYINDYSGTVELIQTICLILFIVGIVLLLLGIVLALVCYKKAASAYGDDSYIPLSSYATKPMNDVGYDAASVGYDPNGGYMPQDNFDQLPVNGQPDPMFTDPQPQPNPADFQNFEPSSIPNYAQDGVYNVPNNNPMPEFEPKSISQFDNVPANNAPAADAYNPGYNAAPAQNAYNPGYNAVPDQNAYNAGYNAAPAQNGYNPGYNAAPVQNAYDPNYNAYPAPAADSGPRLKSTFRAPRNPDGSSYNIPSSAMNQEYTKPHESFKSAGDL